MEDTQSVSQKECGNVFQRSRGISCRGIQSSETSGRDDRAGSGVSGSLSVQKLGALSGPPLPAPRPLALVQRSANLTLSV